MHNRTHYKFRHDFLTHNMSDNVVHAQTSDYRKVVEPATAANSNTKIHTKTSEHTDLYAHTYGTHTHTFQRSTHRQTQTHRHTDTLTR